MREATAGRRKKKQKNTQLTFSHKYVALFFLTGLLGNGRMSVYFFSSFSSSFSLVWNVWAMLTRGEMLMRGEIFACSVIKNLLTQNLMARIWKDGGEKKWKGKWSSFDWKLLWEERGGFLPRSDSVHREAWKRRRLHSDDSSAPPPAESARRRPAKSETSLFRNKGGGGAVWTGSAPLHPLPSSCPSRLSIYSACSPIFSWRDPDGFTARCQTKGCRSEKKWRVCNYFMIKKRFWLCHLWLRTPSVAD